MDGLEDIMNAMAKEEVEFILAVTMAAAINPALSTHEREIAEDGVQRIVAELKRREGKQDGQH